MDRELGPVTGDGVMTVKNRGQPCRARPAARPGPQELDRVRRYVDRELLAAGMEGVEGGRGHEHLDRRKNERRRRARTRGSRTEASTPPMFNRPLAHNAR